MVKDESLTLDCPPEFVPFVYQAEEICIMRDYYSEDGIRTPLTYNQAVAIALENGWGLPTREQVDAIWAAADCQLDPITMSPIAEMTEPWYAELHNRLIEEQLFHSDYENCEIVAGHKKDVLADGSIYGWHRSNGRPIQPVFYGHGDNYRDYSHGIRFIIWEP